jgi:hypothetical protein
VIHSGDGSGVKVLQQQLDGDTRPKTDLQDLIVGANVEQLDDLRRCNPVRARHDHSTQPSKDARRAPEYAHQELAPPSHGFFTSNERIEAESRRFDTYVRGACRLPPHPVLLHGGMVEVRPFWQGVPGIK